ncbi:MAG: Uncharacterized membrane protein YbhN, UPF0104 family [Chloroflexi bacterium]|jgi:hypothetical protein|nr:MAG: Uncharacterized membrane protein YbhN, UPF0104 family [Chloroflexota bacterium]
MRVLRKPRVNRVLLAILGVTFGLGLGWTAIRGAEWQHISEAIRDFPPLLLIAALAIFMVSNFLRAYRWRLCWVDEPVTTWRLFIVENAALGLNNVSPVRALEEAVELGILTLRDKLPGGQVIATMMMARIQDLAFTLLFITVALALVPALLKFTPAIAFVFVFFAAWLFILLRFGAILRRFPRLRSLPAISSFEDALALIYARKQRMAYAFSMTCTYWLLLGPVGWLLARGLDIDIGFHLIMVTVIGSIFFSTTVPGLPGAVGTFEFAAVALMDLWGVPKEPALTFAVLLHGVLFIPPILMTIVVFPREGLGSFRAIREIMGQRAQARQDEPSSPT